MRRYLTALLHRLSHEPVAIYGVLIATGLSLAPSLGVPAHDVDLAFAVLTMLGVPVVRRKVTPLAALRELAAATAAGDTTPAPAPAADTTAPANVEGDAAP